MEQESYRLRCEKGDRVLLPDGHPAVVKDIDIICGGTVKMVTVEPEGPLTVRLRYAVKGWIRWYEGGIDKLKLVMTASEREDAMAEIDALFD